MEYVGTLRKPTGWKEARWNEKNHDWEEKPGGVELQPEMHHSGADLEHCPDGQTHTPKSFVMETGAGGVREFCTRCGKTLTVSHEAR